jgi:hypothetical protein
MLLSDEQELLSRLDQLNTIGRKAKIASLIAFVKRILCKQHVSSGVVSRSLNDPILAAQHPCLNDRVLGSTR